LSGFLVHSHDEYEQELRDAQMSEGAVLSPFDSWLTLRGIKTLSVRMEKHEANARAAAHWLRQHPKVEKVFYTGFSDHPQYELSRKQTRGDSGMVSFYVKETAFIRSILERVKLVLFAESLGGVESLITYPWEQTHTSIPEEMRLRAGVTTRLLRFSAGIENADDIIADLEQAMA
jgi:cystathionine gamma-synthase